MKRLISLLFIVCGSSRAMTEQAVLANGLISCRFLKLSNRQEKLMDAIKAAEEKNSEKPTDEAYHLRNQWLVLLETVKFDMNILRDHSLHFYRRYRRELLTPLLAVYV